MTVSVQYRYHPSYIHVLQNRFLNRDILDLLCIFLICLTLDGSGLPHKPNTNSQYNLHYPQLIIILQNPFRVYTQNLWNLNSNSASFIFTSSNIKYPMTFEVN